MALGELGGKPVQIPNLGGKLEALATLLAKRSEVEGTMFSASEDAERWARNNANILAIHEYLVKEDEIHTAPTQLAVSGQAFALTHGCQPTRPTSRLRSRITHHTWRLKPLWTITTTTATTRTTTTTSQPRPLRWKTGTSHARSNSLSGRPSSLRNL